MAQVTINSDSYMQADNKHSSLSDIKKLFLIQTKLQMNTVTAILWFSSEYGKLPGLTNMGLQGLIMQNIILSHSRHILFINSYKMTVNVRHFQDITFSDVLPICNVRIMYLSRYVIRFLSAIGCDTKFCRVLTNHSQVNKHLVPYFRVQRIF